MTEASVGFRPAKIAIGLLALAFLAGCASEAAKPAGDGSTGAGPAAPSGGPTAIALSSTRAPTVSLMATQSPATPTMIKPSPTIVPTTLSTRTRSDLTPAPRLPGAPITHTTFLDIYRIDGSLPVTALLALAPQFEEAIGRVGARMGSSLTGRVALSFEPPQRGPCALRGLTLSHQRTIHLYYGPDARPPVVLAIVAHELAHQLQHDLYGWEAHQKSDVILLEGQATWASGVYALGDDGRPAWASRAEQALADGALLPLAANLETDCRTATRNTAYTGWASFVDFLIATYGRERFDALYRAGRGRAAGSADYRGIYSKSLDALDQEWRAWLSGRR